MRHLWYTTLVHSSLRTDNHELITVMYKPNYIISPSILSAVSEIAQIKTLVERSRVLPLNEAQMRRQAIVRMAHTSTSIEGNKLAEFQVKKVLAGEKIAGDEKSIQEVKNYQVALQKIEELSVSYTHLTIDKILQLHQILMKGLLETKKSGHFRPASIFVVDDLGNGQEILRYEGPVASKVPFLINQLLLWVNSSSMIHPIIKAGIFHLQFVSIHPFTDGNGRMARLLTQYLLYRDGWDFRKIIVLEDYYNRDRQGYYNAENMVQGKRYQEGQDITTWLEYFVGGFLVEAQKVAEAISSIGFDKIALKGGQVFLDKDEAIIVDFLTTTGRITSQDVQDILGIAKRTAQLRLKALVDKGMLVSQGKGPSTYYVLSN